MPLMEESFPARRGCVVTDGFFHEEDAPLRGESREDVLRSLINEVPSEMRKTDEVQRAGRNT